MGAIALSLSPLIPYPLLVTCYYLGSLIRLYSPYSVPSVQSLIIFNAAFYEAWVCICRYWVHNLGSTNHLCLPTTLTWVFPFFLPPLLSIGYFLLLLLFLPLLLHPLLFKNLTIHTCLRKTAFKKVHCILAALGSSNQIRFGLNRCIAPVGALGKQHGLFSARNSTYPFCLANLSDSESNT